MATKIIAKGVPGGFMCVNHAEAEKAQQFAGKELMVSISIPRNLQFHRKFFALLSVAREMADTECTVEQFRAYVTAGAGYCDFINDAQGRLIAVPKSIRFANMDDTEFERLYQDSLTFICKTWCLDYDDINRIVGFM